MGQIDASAWVAPSAVLTASLSVAFVVLTHEAIADVTADEKGVASGIFETANPLFGGAVGVAVYATVMTAAAPTTALGTGYGAAFGAAAALVITLGLTASLMTRSKSRAGLGED